MDSGLHRGDRFDRRNDHLAPLEELMHVCTANQRTPQNRRAKYTTNNFANVNSTAKHEHVQRTVLRRMRSKLCISEYNPVTQHCTYLNVTLGSTSVDLLAAPAEDTRELRNDVPSTLRVNQEGTTAMLTKTQNYRKQREVVYLCLCVRRKTRKASASVKLR